MPRYTVGIGKTVIESWAKENSPRQKGDTRSLGMRLKCMSCMVAPHLKGSAYCENCDPYINDGSV